MIIVGMDTSTISNEWAMTKLIKNPRVEQKVQTKLDHVIRPNRIVTESDFPNLPYLQCVAKEEVFPCSFKIKNIKYLKEANL